MKYFSFLNCSRFSIIGLAIFTTSILFASKSFAQESKMTIDLNGIDNKNHHKIDYELKEFDFPNGDSTILTHIDLISLEQFRRLNHDIEFFIPEINQTVILYSTNKSFALKTKHSEISN